MAADARTALALPPVRLGIFASWLIVFGSFTPAFLPEGSDIPATIGLGWLTYGAGRALATASVLAGVALLIYAWLSLRPRKTASGGRTVVPIAAWWLWSAPFLLAPPLFSRDAYSYAAQGLIVDRGMDPYTTAPISVPGAFADQVDPMWLFTSSPYGPLALQTQHLIVDLTFGNAYLAAVTMRIPAIIAVMVIAHYLPGLAERLGGSAAVATWLGILNPLVLLHLVGGAHNDAMAIALIVVAIHLAATGHPIAASLTIAAGAGFKQTAVLALVAVAGLTARRLAGDSRPTFGQYFRVAAVIGLVSFAGFAAITFVCGLGWGWIANLSVPMMLRSMLAPFTFLGSLAEAIISALGASAATAALPVTIARIISTTIMIIGIMWATLWLAPRRPALAAVTVFGFFVVCSSVLHPWYVLPAIVLLGTVHWDSDRVRERVFMGAVAVSLFLTAYSAFDVAVSNGGITVALTLGIAVLLRLRNLGMITIRTPAVLADTVPDPAGRKPGPATDGVVAGASSADEPAAETAAEVGTSTAVSDNAQPGDESRDPVSSTG